MDIKKLLNRLNFAKVKATIIAEVKAKNNSNSTIALSLALGAFIAFSPTWGFQTILAIALAVLLRLNKVLVLLTVNISSIPPLIPLIILSGYQVGSLAITGEFQSHIPEIENLSTIGENYLQFALGSLLVASSVGIVFFFIIYFILKLFRV